MTSAPNRHSAIHTTLPWRGIPIPGGTVDQASRQDVVGLYRGILAGTPVVVVAPVGTETWIQELTNDIEAAMRAMGYVLTADAQTVRDRCYTLGVREQLGVEYRGTMKGGLLRVDGSATLQVHHGARAKNKRWMRTIGECQEEIVLGLYRMADWVGVFESVDLEEVEGGHVSTVSFTFRGYHE